jgi:hypothetical protein
VLKYLGKSDPSEALKQQNKSRKWRLGLIGLYMMDNKNNPYALLVPAQLPTLKSAGLSYSKGSEKYISTLK